MSTNASKLLAFILPLNIKNIYNKYSNGVAQLLYCLTSDKESKE